SVINSKMENSTEPNSVGHGPVSLKQQVDLYLHFWKFIIAFLFVSLAISLLYLRYAKKSYYAQGMVILQDEKQAGGEMAGLAELANLAGRTSSSAAYVNDQTQILRSRRLMRKVIESHELNIGYYVQGKMRESEVLKAFSPVTLILLELMDPRLDSTVHEMWVEKSMHGIEVWDEYSPRRQYREGDVLMSPVGPLKLLDQSGRSGWTGVLRIQYRPVDYEVSALQNILAVESNSKEQSFAIRLSVETSSPEKGVLIINSLIDQYDKDRSLDKETIFRNTSKFINSRLDLISGELKSVDSRIASFKKDNSLSDIKYQRDLTLRDASDLEKKVGEYRTQLYLANLVRESSEVDRFGLLPSNIGLEDASVEKS